MITDSTEDDYVSVVKDHIHIHLASIMRIAFDQIIFERHDQIKDHNRRINRVHKTINKFKDRMSEHTYKSLIYDLEYNCNTLRNIR